MIEVCEKAPEKAEGGGWKRIWSVSSKVRGSKKAEEILSNKEWDWNKIEALILDLGLFTENTERLRKRLPEAYDTFHIWNRKIYMEKDSSLPDRIRPTGCDGHSSCWRTYIMRSLDYIFVEYYFVSTDGKRAEIGHRLEVWKKEEGD